MAAPLQGGWITTALHSHKEGILLPDQKCILEMKGIEIQFPGVKALDKVDFSLRAGEVHALLGENGAGKSTLIKCLTGVNKMDAGTIMLDGREIRPTSPQQAIDEGIPAKQILEEGLLSGMGVIGVKFKNN